MSAYGNTLNQRELFRSTLPGFTSPKRSTADRKHLNEPSPAGLMTFEGTPAGDIDVLLEFNNGRFFAQWPPATQRSKRLLWAHAKLAKTSEPPAVLPEGHWMTHLRNTDRLWVEIGRRSERFLLYDAELPMSPPLKVASAEGGYGLTNLGKYGLHDLVVYRPEKEGWISAPLALLESTAKKEEKKPEDKPKSTPEAVFEDKSADGKPDAPATPPADKPAEAKPAEEKPAAVEVKIEAAAVAAPAAAAVIVDTVAAPGAPPVPMPAEGQPAPAPATPPADQKVVTVTAEKEALSKDQISARWKERFTALGLGEGEIQHLVSILQQHALRTDSATVVFRLDDEELDAMLPLEVTPLPQKQIRVAIVVLLDADPDLMKRVEELVVKLGDASYSEREAAAKRLKELGPAARPKLQEAVNNADPEIAFRAETIIDSYDVAPANPQP
jgi:hypothetical protein